MAIYSAKWVLPMDAPPIRDGEIVIENGAIESVRPIQTPANERIDLGNAALLPGLVNAHTHLEYTALRGFLEDAPFFTWIRTLNAFKEQLNAQDWIVSAKLGALECLSSGITTIADNTDCGAAMDGALWTELRGRIYQEFFNIDHRSPVTQTVDELASKLASLNGRKGERLEIGISPHATYTIRPEMFEAARTDPRLSGLPISIHVAESPAEVSLIREGSGPFAQMFARRGIVWTTPGVSPTRYVADQGMLGRKTLLIHCVHQEDADIALAASSGSAIVHCPKSNAKLGAGIAPLKKWLANEGLRLGIGTDSAVSNNSLDLFEEMRFALLAQRAGNEDVSGVTALQMLELATVRGAESLGLEKTIGSLTPGKRADVIAVGLDALHQYPASDPVATLVYSTRGSDVKLTIIDGDVCYDSGRFTNIDVKSLRGQASLLKEKLVKAEIS